MRLLKSIEEWRERRKLSRKYSGLDVTIGDGFETLARMVNKDQNLKALVIKVEGVYGSFGGQPLYVPAIIIRRAGSWAHDGANIRYDPEKGLVLGEWSEPPYGREGLSGVEFHDDFPVNRGTIQESSFGNLRPEHLRDALVKYIKHSPQMKRANENGLKFNLVS